ncbi:MAG: thioredoxin family protein [Marinilabiliales bacterium]|nr:thioredoxin family protein [Marinilabiliales bacterium]
MIPFLTALIFGLTGIASREDIFGIPTFKAKYDACTADRAILQELRADDISVICVFGDWCGDSVNRVPEYMRIAEVLPFHETIYVAVERKLKDDTGMVDALKIERVPTFVFLREGVEIGRIEENPKDTMEGDIRKILEKR